MENKKDILSMSLSDIDIELEKIKEPKFRTSQIFSWLHEKNAEDFSEMTNLSKKLREKLEEFYFIPKLITEERIKSEIDGTEKFLYQLQDNEYLETVFMKYSYGNSLCISTQVGCKMGCTFCASTLAGYKRNLSPAEMLLQVYETEKNTEEKISNIVLMGIGEPLDNLENVIKFLHLINDKNGKKISLRNITISTCGIIEKINKLKEYKLPITLAVSLHAPNQKIRLETMPIARVNRFDDLIKVTTDYANSTKRRVSYEYALIKNVNDSKENAKELAKKLRGTMCHVNLILVNEIKEAEYKKSERSTLEEFQKVLKNSNISTTIRRTLGSDIEAACGQLRRDRI